MKLASLETGIVLLPNDEPLAGFSENPNAKNPIVWLRLRTDDGVEGLGVSYFGGALTRVLRHASRSKSRLATPASSVSGWSPGAVAWLGDKLPATSAERRSSRRSSTGGAGRRSLRNWRQAWPRATRNSWRD